MQDEQTMRRSMTNELTHAGTVAALAPPAAISQAGAAATFAWDEFFIATLRNRNTRAAYLRAVSRFLAWVAPQEADLKRITPGLVGRYFDDLDLAIPSKKLHLSAIRRFFDLLVQRHVIVLNPALSVRNQRYSIEEGRTPEIGAANARKLLESITGTDVIDLRDKALIGTLIYTAVRASALVALRLSDFAHDGTQHVLRFGEKGGKARTIPVRHDLEQWIVAYRAVLPVDGRSDMPLFRTIAATGSLSGRPMTRLDIWRLMKRRLAHAGLPTVASPHSCRVTTLTDLLEQGVAGEDVQYLAGHADARTTRLYDRRQRRISRNIVERISF